MPHFLREQLQVKMSPHYGFSTFFSSTFKYVAELPRLVSRFGLRSMEAAISRELSSDTRQELYLLEVQVFTDHKGRTSAGSLKLVE